MNETAVRQKAESELVLHFFPPQSPGGAQAAQAWRLAEDNQPRSDDKVQALPGLRFVQCDCACK